MRRLSRTVIAEIDAWAARNGGPLAVCVLLDEARRRRVHRMREAPATTDELGRWVRRELRRRRRGSTFFASREVRPVRRTRR